MHLALYGLVSYALRLVAEIAWLAFSVYLMKVSEALRLLFKYVHETGICLEKGDIKYVRRATSSLVKTKNVRLRARSFSCNRVFV